MQDIFSKLISDLPKKRPRHVWTGALYHISGKQINSCFIRAECDAGFRAAVIFIIAEKQLGPFRFGAVRPIKGGFFFRYVADGYDFLSVCLSFIHKQLWVIRKQQRVAAFYDISILFSQADQFFVKVQYRIGIILSLGRIDGFVIGIDLQPRFALRKSGILAAVPLHRCSCMVPGFSP